MTTEMPLASLGVADCHSSARAAVSFERDADELRLCLHCSKVHHDKLIEQGWVRAGVDLHDPQAQEVGA